MTYLPALGNQLSGSGLPPAEASGTTAWRALLALSVVFVLLATTGWTAVHEHSGESGPRTAALESWSKGSIAGRDLPDPEADPSVIAPFMASLSERQQNRLADRYPLVVGNLGGAPVELRYRANHRALEDARDVERSRMVDDRLTDEGRQSAERRMHRFASLLLPDRQILAFDPAGRGRAAEVFGNLDNAQRVSVVVPGVDTELTNFERTQRKYSAPVGMAHALQEKEEETAPTVPTATVAWADYTAPTGLGVAAASGGSAEEGAQRLTDFVGSLPQLDRSRVALFCHSYGSVVCGVAADDLPEQVSDIAVAASPGMRVDRAGDLDTSARIWAMRDSDDWIADVPHMNVGGLGHGADPVGKGFGARRLSAAGAEGHTGYFVPGTSSLANFAAIGTGSYHLLDCAARDPSCTAGVEHRTSASSTDT